MRRRAFLVVVSALLVGSAACSDSSDEADGQVTATTSAPTSTTSIGGSTTAIETTSSSGTSSTTIVADGFTTDEGLVWTVIGVDFDDTLNVRAEPDPASEILDELEPWATGFPVSVETADEGAGVWRMVETPTTVGWVNSRFLVAQPRQWDPSDADVMVQLSQDFVDWARTGSGPGPESWLAERALWVDGIGIYGDGVNGAQWIPRSELLTFDDWTTVRTFDPPFGDDSCGSDCELSVVDYLRLETLGELYEFLPDDVYPEPNRGFVDGALGQAPEGLHRVVIDEPATADKDAEGNTIINLDWQRIHVVFDWSTGEPGIALLHTWGWTP